MNIQFCLQRCHAILEIISQCVAEEVEQRNDPDVNESRL